jgi:hypothetical protein
MVAHDQEPVDPLDWTRHDVQVSLVLSLGAESVSAEDELESSTSYFPCTASHPS